ncbi:MAG: hypothetical protein ACPGUC_08685 [Gammaproteobacteria bacterium]
MNDNAPVVDPRCVDLPHAPPLPPAGAKDASPPPDTFTRPHPRERTGGRFALPELLPGLLRILGSMVIIAATGLFLFQHWTGGDDLHRFLLLLSYTVILTGLGFATKHWLNEAKSARLFIGLGLVAVSTSVTVLAALLYGQWGTPQATLYPAYFLWQGVLGPTLWLTAGISLVILAAQARLGFMVLAREPSAAMTGLFLLNAGLLLIPLRDPRIVSAIALAGFVFSQRTLGRLRARHLSLRTPSAVAARLAVYLPLAIMTGRSAYLYAAGDVAVVCIALLAYATLRQLAQLDGLRPAWRLGLLTSASAPALAAAFAATSAALEGNLIAGAYAPLSVALLFGAPMFDLHRISAPEHTRFASMGISSALLAALLLLFATGATVGIAAPLGLVLLDLFTARGARLRKEFHFALVSLAVTLMVGGVRTIGHFTFDHTLGLAASGIALVLAAALIERHGQRIGQWLRMPGPDH